MTKLFSKLSHRYALIGVVVFALLMLLFVSLSLILVQQRTDDLRANLVESFKDKHFEFVITAMKNDSRYISDRLFDPLQSVETSRLNEEVARIVDWLKPDRLLVLDEGGRVVTTGSEDSARTDELIDISSFSSERTIQVVPIDTGHRLILPIAVDSLLAGYAVIELSNEQDQQLIDQINREADDKLQEFYHYFTTLAVLGVVLLIIVGTLLAWRLRLTISDPLFEMVEATKRYAEGDLDYRLPDSLRYKGEIGHLAESFERMASKLEAAEKQIVRQAHFDTLTDLPNRFLTLDRMNQMLLEAKRDRNKVAVIFLDLDNFKKVNDSMGHHEGDNLLHEAGIRLKSAVRQTDVVGRLGGDEFLVIIGGINDALDVQNVIEAIQAKFREPFETLNLQPFRVTLSLGVSIYPDDGTTSAGLLRNADLAMYHAKQSGRNTNSYFTEEMNQKVSRRLQVENALYNALQNGEMYVVYQPQYSLSDGTIVGAEALIRWNSPQLGMVSPDEFISVAEHAGLIAELSSFVISESFPNLASWLELAPNFRLAINLSPIQFDNSELLNSIYSDTQKHGLNPKQIELEITEGVLIRNQENSKNVLAQLSHQGFNLAIDDFGTGYSSLVYLRAYPFDVLKIDRSFVMDVCDDPNDRELISAMIAMAKALNLQTIAEGIEDQAQYDALKQLGCDLGQGYLMSRPLPAEELTGLLKR